MTETFFFERGDSPLLVSIPHDGRELAPGMEERMTALGRSIPDTDWHVGRLYGFANQLGASVLAARFSRYVIDLNRPTSDAALYVGQKSTGLCPSKTFAGSEIYKPGKACNGIEQRQRIQSYWNPYHAKLQDELLRIRKQFGYALLWDAHSIQSRVPRLFDDVLPDLNLGTNDGKSCSPRLQDAVHKVGLRSNYTVALNGRFKGGHITRTYGDPNRNVHAMQLELAQCTYMDEDSFRYNEQTSIRLIKVIQEMLNAFVTNAPRMTGN